MISLFMIISYAFSLQAQEASPIYIENRKQEIRSSKLCRSWTEDSIKWHQTNEVVDIFIMHEPLETLVKIFCCYN